MIDESVKLAILEASAQRGEQRRRFMKLAGGAAAAAGAMSFLAGCDDNNDNNNSGNTPTPTPTATATPTPSPTPTPTPTPTSGVADVDIFNFALNLEYLEANFYLTAAFGAGLTSADTSGTGRLGQALGGRKVNFTDTAIMLFAREIAVDELAHVRYIRSVLGSSAVAQPTVNIAGGPNGAFTAAARAAGVVGPNGTFDPYASDENFLLAASLLSDVGVTAYKGSARLITNPVYIEAAAGLLATEAYHSGLLRTNLYGKGLQEPNLDLAGKEAKISDARDALDGPSDDDQPIILNGKANIVPANENGIVFGRTAAQVLNVVYLNAAAVTAGGFLPNGANGTINTSGANTRD